MESRLAAKPAFFRINDYLCTMKQHQIPSPFSGSMKMVGLIDHNPDLLGLIVRMELPLGFGEQTVAEVCRRARVDVTTFLLMCQVYTLPRFVPSRSELRVVRPEDLLRYLRSSHRYYVGTSLVSMSHALEELLAPAPQAKQKVIRRFYEDYRTDLEKHFEFEENVVFPYVDALVRGEFADGEGYGLDEEDHTHIGEKIEDLKNIVLKYLPEECDPAAASAFVARIYTLAADLHRHSAIEEKLLDPVVRDDRQIVGHSHGEAGEESRSELSAREKEILVAVAQGMLNKEIADRYNLSIHTVITHRKNITRKTGIKTVAGLTVYALLNGLIDPDSVE